jgi:2-iminobutanoate/2-iminopropanoate deaminase
MSDLGIVSTERAPEAIGPYAQALVCEGWIHTSGQIPLDPESGTVVAGGIEAQTDRVLRNLAEVLAEAGGGLDSVVKTTVYLADLADFARMNEVYARHFGSHRPARSTVQVARLPRDVAVEIDAVARVRG